MSIFIPYDINSTINYLSNLFSIDLSSLTSFENILLTLFANLYFFLTWYILIYFALKIFNRIWERLF